MLTIEQTNHHVKISWNFAKILSSDLAEFEKINSLIKKEPIEEGIIKIIGENEVPLLVWKGFLSLVKTLLDQNAKLRFVCSSKTTVEALKLFGFSLLGTIEQE